MTIEPKTISGLLEKAEQDSIQKLVVGAIIIKDGCILILRRASTEDFLPGLEEIPSGGVDAGETLLEALHREVWEETGLTITEICSYENAFDYVSGSGRKTREFNFLVKTDGHHVTLNPKEHDHFAWLSPDTEDFQKAALSDETRACLVDFVERHQVPTKPASPIFTPIKCKKIILRPSRIILTRKNSTTASAKTSSITFITQYVNNCTLNLTGTT